ncbi:MAG: hypothetical protein RLZZ399_2691 [Verrucomicrobiota bacterium]|jgi:glycosyltransferase involved in cell wall biosynthesis
MQASHKLSICIPTYNRKAFLMECLESFLPEATRYGIPILVADNESNDGTLEFLREFQERYPLLRYQSSRCPLYQGITNSVEMASTEYCWLFSDDDCVFGKPIELILEALSAGMGMIILNALTMDKQLLQVVEERRIQSVEDILYRPGEHESFLKETAFYTSFLGCAVIHRDKFLHFQGLGEGETYFRHLSSMLRYCPNEHIQVIAKPCIKIRLNNSVWSANRFDVLMLDWPRFIWNLPSCYSDDCKRAVVNPLRIGSLREMLAARAFGMLNLEVYLSRVAPSTQISDFKKSLLLVIAQLPVWALRALFGLYLHLLRPRGYRVYLHDLQTSP